MRVVVSLLVRGLVRGLMSLSFGKVLVGATMLWMAVTSTAMNGHAVESSMSAHQKDGASLDASVEAPVELVGFFGQDPDGSGDGSGVVPVPRWVVGAQPAASGSVPASVSVPRVRQAAPVSGTTVSDTEVTNAPRAATQRAPQAAPAASAALSTERAAPVGRTGSVADFVSGLLQRFGQAWGGLTSGTGSGGRGSSGGSSSGGPGGGVAAASAVSTTGQQGRHTPAAAPGTVRAALAQARVETGLAGQSAGEQLQQQPSGRITCGLPCEGRGPSPVRPTPPPGHVTCGLPCEGFRMPQPTPTSATGSVGQLMGGVVDLVSGIVTTVAGKPAGEQTRQRLSEAADQVSTALAAGHKLATASGAGGPGGAMSTAPNTGSGTGRGSGKTYSASKQTDTQAAPALPADYESTLPGCSGGLRCAAGNQTLAGCHPGAQAARGPPAAGRDRNQKTQHSTKDSDDENGPARAQADAHALDGTTLNKIFDQAGESTRNLIGDLSTLSRNSKPSGMSGGNGGSSGHARTAAQPNGTGSSSSDSLTGKLTKLTHDFVSNLLKLVGVGQSAGQSNSGSGGGSTSGDGSSNQSSGQGSLTDSISQLTDNFVSSLLQLLGIGQQGGQSSGNGGGGGADSSASSTGQQQDSQSDGQGNLADSISQLTDSFVSNLLQLLDISPQSGQSSASSSGGGSSGTGSGSQSDGQGSLTDSISQLTDSFVSSLLQLLGVGQQGGQSNSGGSGNSSGSASGMGSGGQGSLADSIGQMTDNFVSNLLQLLGLGQSGNSSGGDSTGQQQGGQSSGQASSADSISQLTDSFVSSLLQLLGLGQQGGQSSGSATPARGQGQATGQGGGTDQQTSFTGQTGQSPADWMNRRPRVGGPANWAVNGSGSGLDEQRRRHVDQALVGVVDLVSGLVSTVAGQQAGGRVQQTLTGLANEVSDAISVAANNELDSRGWRASGANAPGTAGAGHSGLPATVPDTGQQSPSCAGYSACLIGNQPTTRRPQATAMRGPPAQSTNMVSNTSSNKSAKKSPLPKGTTAAQAANAATIVRVGQRMGIPQRGLRVALAAALQESGLRNPHHGEADSLGLFQQRPSRGWGSPSQNVNPTYAATQFFSHLKQVPGWAQKSITSAAQAVQRSATPSAYARWANKAATLVMHVQGSGQASTSAAQSASKPTATATPKSLKPSTSPQRSTGTGSGTGSTGQGGLADSVSRSTDRFVYSLLRRVGVSQQGGQFGNNSGSTGGVARSVGIDGLVGSILDSVSDLTRGILGSVSSIVGKALSGTSTSSNSSGAQSSGQGSLADSISQLTDNFVSILLQRIGISQQAGQSNSGGSSTGSGTDSGGQGSLADSIGQLTDSFVSNLLRLVGVGQQGGQSGGTGGGTSGGSGSVGLQQQGTTGSGGQNNLANSIAQLTNSFVSNLLNLLGLGQSGGQSGTGSGMTGSGSASGGQNGGQIGGWSLNNAGGQFAGTACQRQVECALANGTLSTRQPAMLGSRTPPPLLDNNGNTSNATSPYRLASWWSGLDSSSSVSRALNDRLAVIKGQQALDAAKTQLGQKKISQADYDKKVAAQKALVSRADQEMGQLGPSDSQLINNTISGQQGLATAKSKLDAAAAQVKAGKLSQAAYDQQAAAYQRQQQQVYAQTARLQDAAGYTPATQADPGQNGAGAACSVSGMFGECSTAAVDPTTGQTKQDQALCLSGISGCSSTVTVGDRSASAVCDPAKGCDTSTKAAKITAHTSCGVGDCNTSSTADAQGAETFCQARAGCAQSGKTPTPADQADLAAGKTQGSSQTQGTCTNNCALAGFATVTEAGSDCQSGNGACDSNSTGSRASSTTPDPKPAPAGQGAVQAARQTGQANKDNGSATSKAHCQANSVGCDTTTTVTAGIDPSTGQRGWLAQPLFGPGQDTTTTSSAQPTAQAAAHCAQGATGCSGNTATNTGARTENADAIPAPGTPAENTDSSIRSGTSSCQVTGGACTSSSGPSDTGNNRNDGQLSYTAVSCEQAAGCSGKGATATHASATAGQDDKTATRTTDAHHACTVGGATGECSTDSSSTAANTGTNNTGAEGAELASATTPRPKTDLVAALGQGLSASSQTTGAISCGSKDCKGTESGATSGAASGDIKAKDSAGVTSCDVHGTGGSCGSVASSDVSYRAAQTGLDGKTELAGPVSVSHADAQVRCQDSTQCGGKAHTATSALDTSVSTARRGSSTGADCTVNNGGCVGQAGSDASTTTDYVKIDPKTGEPLPGQPGSGPTSASRAGDRRHRPGSADEPDSVAPARTT